MSRNARGCGALVVAALVLCAGCDRGPEQKQKPKAAGADKGAGDRVLARVGRTAITEARVEEAMAQLPQHLQGDYAGATGRMRLLDQLVNRELIVQAARDAGLDRDPAVARQVSDFETNVLAGEYQRRLVDALPQPTEADMQQYYKDHPQEFVVQARVNASWIQCRTHRDAEAARRRVTDGKENFIDVAREVSIHEETKPDGGLLGYFNPTGFVRGIGNDPDFNQRAFELEAGDVGPVFEWRGTWGFFKVHEKATERAEPYGRARERILMRLKPTFSDSLYQAELARLRAKYKVDVLVNIDQELEGKSADDIMRLATESPNAMDKIQYYRALIRKYPQYPRADEAQFMIGFLFSEELGNLDAAREEYNKVISGYPTSDIVESARYMLQNMGSNAPPPFEIPGRVQEPR